MNTLKRLNDNSAEFEAQINERMNDLRAEINARPWRVLRNRMARKQLEMMREQLQTIRGRYNTIYQETRLIIYHA